MLARRAVPPFKGRGIIYASRHCRRSRMRRAARTDLRGGRSAMAVRTTARILMARIMDAYFVEVARPGRPACACSQALVKSDAVAFPKAWSPRAVWRRMWPRK